jgi:hypothetical protein
MWFKVLFLLTAGANALVFETGFGDRLNRLARTRTRPLSAKVTGARHGSRCSISDE